MVFDQWEAERMSALVGAEVALEVAEDPLCPECGADMVRKLVQRGPRAGLEMWSCSRYPTCRGLINIDTPSLATAHRSAIAALPGAYAQRRHERELERVRLKRRAVLPMFVAGGLLVLGLVFVSLQAVGMIFAWVGAVVIGLVFIVGLFRLPIDSLVWTKGVEGERRTARYLDPLMDRGFIALYNRLVPGQSGDIDCILIGPTGIFAIETKNWSGSLEVRNDRLFLGESDRSWAIDQLFREAIAVQIALWPELNAARMTVVPILCAVGGVKIGRTARGIHVTNGKDLAEFIASRPVVFSEEQINDLANLAERNLRAQYVWEAVSAES